MGTMTNWAVLTFVKAVRPKLQRLKDFEEAAKAVDACFTEVTQVNGK